MDGGWDSLTCMLRYVKPVLMIRVGGTRCTRCTRCVTWSIDRIIQRHAWITLNVAWIRAFLAFLQLYCVFEYKNGSMLTLLSMFFDVQVRGHVFARSARVSVVVGERVAVATFLPDGGPVGGRAGFQVSAGRG